MPDAPAQITSSRAGPVPAWPGGQLAPQWVALPSSQRLAVSSGSGCAFLQPEAGLGRRSTAAGLGEQGKGLQHGHLELCLCSRDQQGTPDPWDASPVAGISHQSSSFMVNGWNR